VSEGHRAASGRVQITAVSRTGADLQLRVYPGRKGLAHPSPLAIEDVSLLGPATARLCLELGQLATWASAAGEQARWTPEPGCPRWMSKLVLAQSELGSIRFSRIVGPDWLAKDVVSDRRARRQTKQGLL
jgi:hypothetical protein